MPEKDASEFNYESDFEDENEQTNSERSHSSRADKKNEVDDDDDDEDVTFDEDDLLEMLEDEKSDRSQSNSVECKEEGRKVAKECTFEERNEEVCEEEVDEDIPEDISAYEDDFEVDVIPFEMEERKDVDDEAVTEDITVEEIDVEGYDYAEDIELDEKSKEEGKIIYN